jgi:hypothetical protein
MSILAYFPYFVKIKVSLWNHLAVCVHLYKYPPHKYLNAWTNIYETYYVYIMAPEPILTAYFNNHFHQSVCLYVYPLSLLGNGSVNIFPRIINTRNSRRTVRRVVSYAAFVVSKEILWACLCIPLPLLGNGSVKTSRQRIFVGGVVSYEVRVVSKKSRWLVLPGTFCFLDIVRDNLWKKYAPPSLSIGFLTMRISIFYGNTLTETDSFTGKEKVLH